MLFLVSVISLIWSIVLGLSSIIMFIIALDDMKDICATKYVSLFQTSAQLTLAACACAALFYYVVRLN